MGRKDLKYVNKLQPPNIDGMINNLIAKKDPLDMIRDDASLRKFMLNGIPNIITRAHWTGVYTGIVQTAIGIDKEGFPLATLQGEQVEVWKVVKYLMVLDIKKVLQP